MDKNLRKRALSSPSLQLSMILPMLLRHFDYLIGPSGELADVEYMKRRNKAVYIANGCDTDEFYPINKSDIQMKRLALGLPKDRKIVYRKTDSDEKSR